MNNKKIEKVLKEMFPKSRLDRLKARRCIQLLELNGGKYSRKEFDNAADDFFFDFLGYGIEFTNKEIVFIGDSGDFAHIQIDYYTLLGYMMHMSMLSLGFKRAYHEREEPEEETKCPHLNSKPKFEEGGIIKPQKDAENILAEKICLTLTEAE